MINKQLDLILSYLNEEVDGTNVNDREHYKGDVEDNRRRANEERRIAEEEKQRREQENREREKQKEENRNNSAYKTQDEIEYDKWDENQI